MEGPTDIVVLEDGTSSTNRSFTREVFWIELLSMAGAKLTNASIDFGGKYFLADYPLESLSDDCNDSREGSASDVRSDDAPPFRIEL